MSIGVLIFEGMKVGILPGDMQIGIDESGAPNSHAILSTAYNVLPIWLRAARDSLRYAKTASDDVAKRWNDVDDNGRKELLISELEPSLQVFVACGIVLDALYDLLRPFANISGTDLEKWRRNKTERGKQIAEVIRRVYKLDKKVFKQFSQNILAIVKYRNLAVHPSNDLENACNRPDIPVGVDWKFAMYRFQNSERCYTATNEMLRYLYTKECDEEKVNELMRNIFKALRELGVVE